MRVPVFCLLTLFFLPTAAAQPAGDPPSIDEAAYARITTSLGIIDVALFREDAPISTQNFLEYATSGFYDQLIFHRVIDGVLIQGGGYSRFLSQRATRDTIVNEATNGLKNTRGTLGMARYDEPDSATSQFYINLQDNPNLDRTGDVYKLDAGYAVFGEVVSGMDVADAIGAVETGPAERGTVRFESEVPVEPILILRIDPIAESDVGNGVAP